MSKEDFLDKPFKLVSLVGVVYLIISIVLNIFTGFSYNKSLLPYSKLITFLTEGIAFILCLLTFIFSTKHTLYYVSLEILIFGSIYTGEIYITLFLSSLLLVLLVTEHKIFKKRNLIIYSLLEIGKLGLVIPYGVTIFFNYVGLTLFYMCTIGCINLLFRHAYSRKESSTINLDDYKLTERQKNCIKEIVQNNTTIKALAIDYNISESAIKKDLAHIYDILGITGKADLKALFIGYKF